MGNKFKIFFLLLILFSSISIFPHNQKLIEVFFVDDDEISEFLKKETCKVQNIKHINFVVNSVFFELPIDFYENFNDTFKKDKNGSKPITDSPLINKNEIQNFFIKELRERAPYDMKFYNSAVRHPTYTNVSPRGFSKDSATVYLSIGGRYSWTTEKNELYSTYDVELFFKDSFDLNPLDIYATSHSGYVPSDKLDEELKRSIILLIERFYAVHDHE